MSKRCFFASSCKSGGGGWRVCHLVGIQTIIKRSKERNDNYHLDKLVETEGDEATIDCHKSCVSCYVSVTRHSSQGKKRRSSSTSDTHRVLRSRVTSTFIWRKHCFLCGEECKELHLSRLLCTFDRGRNVHMIGRADSFVTHDEADITIISYMLRAAAAGASVIRILCDDSDLFILAVYWMWKKQVKCHVQFEKWDHTVLDVNATVAALGVKCRDLLGMYALAGCDTVSFPCGKGKLTAHKVIQNNDITGLDTVLGREDAILDRIKKTTEEFFRALYGQKKAASLTGARCRVYKSRKKNLH